jgi:hypothetical protein
MSSIPSGNGRCSFSASTVSPSSQRSNSSVVVALDRRALRPSHAPPPPPEAREGEQRPVFAERKQVGVLRGFVSAYSQNDVAGTRQRFLAESQPRQCGLETLRMLVTGWPPNCSGPGMPQRAMTSSRSPSALLRTIGASWSGKIPGNVRNRARMGAWPLVSEYRSLRGRFRPFPINRPENWGPASTNGLLPATVASTLDPRRSRGHCYIGHHLLRLWSAAKSWVLPLTS